LQHKARYTYKLLKIRTACSLLVLVMCKQSYNLISVAVVAYKSVYIHKCERCRQWRQRLLKRNNQHELSKSAVT